MSPDSIALCSSLSLAAALGCAAFALARVPPLPRPELGARGLQRARTLDSPLLRVPEAALRWLAGLAALAPWPALRARIELECERAGYPLGLCADECIALCAALATATATTALALDLGPLAALLALGAGAAAPLWSLRDRARARRREIARRLPGAIDLMALCMGAGLDFAAALELVAGELEAADGELACELRRLLQELAVGRVRQRALAEFAERVPAPAVHDFAQAVIQAERRGTPLAHVLEVQARMLRMRRSVAAEEAAARASVLLMLPLLLLLLAVLLLLFGPFLVNGVAL
jgi:tight adherence protein C